MTLICGTQEGETVLISGGVHNAEYVGIQSAIQLSHDLEPDKISGQVIIIHLMNPTGFQHRTMSLVYEDGKNLNRVFPGGPHGTMAEKIAFTVEQEFFTKADYYIDLHCGDGFEGLVSYVYCLGNADDYVVKKSREIPSARVKCWALSGIILEKNWPDARQKWMGLLCMKRSVSAL